MLLIASRLFGIPGIQVSQAMSDILSAIIAAPMIFRFFRALPASPAEPPSSDS